MTTVHNSIETLTSIKGDHIRGCDDFDECSNGTHDCSTNAECRNFPGTFSCKCPPMFSGEGNDETLIVCYSDTSK